MRGSRPSGFLDLYGTHSFLEKNFLLSPLSLSLRISKGEMAEEQRCQEAHRLCANGCGFFGSPATLNLCSKCYRDLRLKEDQASSVKVAVEKSLFLPSSSSPVAAAPFAVELTEEAAAGIVVPEEAAEAPKGPSRCAACRKRVGLTGFSCRCGKTCCGAHRHPEGHGCTFDFRAPGREAIARDNPVVKADKLHKI